MEMFWAKVFFKEFIKHYRKMNDEQMAADVNASMDALEDLDGSGKSFGAKMVRWSMERADTPFATAARENGKKGGRPRKNNGDADTSDGSDASTTVSTNIGNDQGTEARQSMRTGEDSVRRVGVASPAVCHKSAGAPVRNSGRRFRNKEEYMQWAIDSGLDATDASECWDATLERGGKDADGNKVVNIKAFAKMWCRTRAENRRKTA